MSTDPQLSTVDPIVQFVENLRDLLDEYDASRPPAERDARRIAELAVLAAADRFAARWLRAREIPVHMHLRELVDAVRTLRETR